MAEPRSVPADSLLRVVPYRCPCGNAIGLINTIERECLRCGREIPESAFVYGDATLIGQVTPEGTPQDVGPDDSLVGERIRHFRVLDRLGRGGMGTVYRAIDESLQRYVALKVLRFPQTQATSPEAISRLFLEARAQARICHPNVVQVYYVDPQPDVPFLAMELVSGESLDDRLARRPLTFEEIIDIACQTTMALEAAARFRIIHGDIKPANLLISSDGVVKLSDFGLARSDEGAEQGILEISGTPNYLSPERCAGRPGTYQSDMYSLGVMLFEMTFCTLPFGMEGLSITDRLKAHQEVQLEYPQPWPGRVPPGWKAVLNQLLEKDPANRYSDYSTLLSDLRDLTPVNRPRAGRTVRALAWITDLFFLLIATQIVHQIFSVGMWTWEAAFLTFMGTVLSCAFLMIAALAQAVLRTTPGKKLFQIRVVDEHGLKADQSCLFFRALAQHLPMWGLVLAQGFGTFELRPMASLTVLGVGLLTITDIAWTFVNRKRQSLHDWLSHTQVTLDIPVSREKKTTAETIPSQSVHRWRRATRAHSTAQLKVDEAG